MRYKCSLERDAQDYVFGTFLCNQIRMLTFTFRDRLCSPVVFRACLPAGWQAGPRDRLYCPLSSSPCFRLERDAQDNVLVVPNPLLSFASRERLHNTSRERQHYTSRDRPFPFRCLAHLTLLPF